MLIIYRRQSVKKAIACLIARCVRSVSCVRCVTSNPLRHLRQLCPFVASATSAALDALRCVETPLKRLSVRCCAVLTVVLYKCVLSILCHSYISEISQKEFH